MARRTAAAVGPEIRLLPSFGREAPLPLDEQQQALAGDHPGAQLVLGPAGSGKSAVLLEALAGRCEGGTAADRLLGLASDQGAARRWRAAMAARIGAVPPLITTIHALALQQVRTDAARRLSDPPRLLSGSDQLQIVGDIVRAHPTAWPPMFADAVHTRSFVERVRDVIIRAGRAGWTADRLAAATGPAAWAGVAEVWREYQRVLALAGSMDYTELLRRAVEIAAHGPAGRWQCIAVDGYLELDPQQLRLLAAIRPPGSRLLAAGDCDQSSDAFRGAAQDAATGFAQLYRDARPVVVLTGSYRFGSDLEQLRVVVAAPLPMAGLPAAAVRAQRLQRSASPAAPSTVVEALSYPDGFAEAAGVAAIVRRFATDSLLQGAQPRWRDAAVVVRSTGQLAVLEQALRGAGVPVVCVAAGQSPGLRLADAPIVRQLATGLRLAAVFAGLSPRLPDPAEVHNLLGSGVMACDPSAVRRLLQHLRREETAAAASAGTLARTAHEILLDILRQGGAPTGLSQHRRAAWQALRELHGRLAAAAELIVAGADVEAVLWALWSEEPYGPGKWARRLQRTALSGGPAGAAADRDLDAVLALFATARRSVARGGAQQVMEFLASLPGLPWPGDRLAATAARGNAVTLLTAHRAKGRQWPLVVVAGVQEGIWPNDAAGLGLLGEELLTDPDATAVSMRAAHVADERRLFLLAVTRASAHLVVTAVAARDRDPSGPQPSRFIADTGLHLRPAPDSGGPRLSQLGVVIDLRAAAAADVSLAEAAVPRLAQLQGDPDFPWADPRTWWGTAAPTRSQCPLVGESRPVELTVTGLTELTTCPWRWFVTRMLHGGTTAPLSAGIGRLVHRVHEAWSNAEIERELSAAQEIVDQVWPVLPFDAQWQSQRHRTDVQQSLLRLLDWQVANADRISFAERPFAVAIDVADGEQVVLRGKIDVALDAGSAGIAVLDIKTAKSPPTQAEIGRHIQLAGYQAAVATGGLADAAVPAGAGLLMASVAETGGGNGPKVLWQPPLDLRDPQRGGWFVDLLGRAAARIRAESFPAIESSACRTCPITALCPAKAPGQEVCG